MFVYLKRKTGLFIHSSAGLEETIQVLIERGVDVNAMDGTSALILAAEQGNFRINSSSSQVK